MSDVNHVYKICSAHDWQEALSAGRYTGSAHDRRDGFIHLSAADQLAGTASKHYRGAHGLVLVALDAARLGATLKWEPSRDGALFPHVYGPLDLGAVLSVHPLELDASGLPIVPEDLDRC